LVLESVDAIAQLQFAFLKTLDLKQIGPRRVLQCCDCGIEIAMFLSQARKLRPELVFFVLGHRRRCAYVE
jgi:hypothetical protein